MVKADEHRQELDHIQVVGFRPTGLALHLNAGRVHHQVLDTVSQEVAVEPEAVASGLVATENTGILGEAEALASAGDFLLEGRKVSSRDDMLAGWLSQPDGEAEAPLLVAQFKSEIQGRLGDRFVHRRYLSENRTTGLSPESYPKRPS